jgi:Leucine-rich repeat (LRR) protein
MYNLKLREIDEVAFSGLKKLEILDISATDLHHLHPKTFNGLVSLKQLNLYTIWAEALDKNLFSDLINLEYLNLGNNVFAYLPEKLFENLTSLKKLDLANNPIKSLSANLFKNLINVEELSFYAALFETVPDDIFKYNGNLASIKLQANITRMSSKIFSHLKKLKYINLVDNDCVSMEIPNPNSNILLTEDILTPCSCQVSEDGRNPYHLDVFFVLIGFLVAIISAIFVMMLVKCCRQKKILHPMEFYLGLKDGKFLPSFYNST